jgi:hypothetical protein
MSLGSFKLFNWDARLAVVDEDTLEGFVLSPERGWLPVNSAYIGLDGRVIDGAFAEAAFGAELKIFGSNPKAARQSSGNAA